MNTSFRIGVLAGILVLLSSTAWAHVVVTPKKVGLASWVTFTVSVPNEKETVNTQLKLILPDGIDSVTPTVKAGWAITLEKDAQGKPTAIVWSGSLPAEFRDEFSFSAHVPDKAQSLSWKAYQTYPGGMVVAWDVDPKAPEAKDPEALEKTGRGPASVTDVVDDLTSSGAAVGSDSMSWPALLTAIAAFVVAVIALFRRNKIA